MLGYAVLLLYKDRFGYVMVQYVIYEKACLDMCYAMLS